MPTDEAMLNEAILAARAGDKARARDLLTRLLQIDKSVPDHWLWMSAVVETRQEQIFCLQNLLKVDPRNEVARRGLVLMGELEAGPKGVEPVVARRKKAWTVRELEIERPRGWRAVMANPLLRVLVYLVIASGALGLVFGAVSAYQASVAARPTPNFNATAQAVGAVTTLTPTITPSPTATNPFETSTATPRNPTPLALLLEATYTPTPRYVNTPHPQVEAFRLGLLAQARGDWAAMADLMQQTIDLDPTAADAYYYLGLALLEMDEPSRALNAFVQSTVIDNQFGPAYLGRALARLAIDPQTDVSRDFQNAITRSSDFGLIYIERARYLISNRQFSNAAADLSRAETLLPDSPMVPYLRALLAFSQQDFSEARSQAVASFEKDRTYLPTYRLLGEIEFSLGNYPDALEWFQTYNRFEPADSEVAALLAQSMAGTGAIDDALAIFDQLIDGNTANADFYLGRGLTYIAAGDYESAFRDLNQANRLRRSDYDILLALSIALIETGEPGSAYLTLNETLPLSKDTAQEAVVRYHRGRALFFIVQNGDSSSIPAARRDLENAAANENLLPEAFVKEAQRMLDLLNTAP